MSSYPGNLDTTFPGFPYTDYIENLDATQANAWCESIIAIEETIGYGTAGTYLSPLYSATYNAYFPTVTARIAALEGIVYGEPKLNTDDSVIQTVGTVNQAGHTGLAADAGHVHQKAPVVEIPISGIILWPAAVAPIDLPSNLLPCDGRALPRSSYPDLYNLIGYNFGHSGAGSSGNWANFLLPNPADKFPIGAGGTFANMVGQTGGTNNLGTAHLPNHSHGITDVTHNHESFIEDGATGDMTRFQGVYTDPGSTLWLMPVPPEPYGAVGATWSPAQSGEGGGYQSPGFPPDISHQNHWKSNYSGLNGTAGVNGWSAQSQYNPPFMGFWFLIRVI